MARPCYSVEEGVQGQRVNYHVLCFICTREKHIKCLRETAEYDVLVIGGGATGCGVALDAVTRGISKDILTDLIN